MILELKDICKDYMQGKMTIPVLKNVNFTMKEGEYTAIMGPSGSGKTTLMNIIGCLDKATSGAFFLDGVDINSCSDNAMSDIRLNKIGFVFQSFQLLPRQSALENVELPLSYAGVGRRERQEKAIAALTRVGLEDRVDFKPTQLSGGQKQRVAIARAMVNNPKILLADQPTGALDSRSGEQVMELFGRLNQEGVTILMITHDAGIASYATAGCNHQRRYPGGRGGQRMKKRLGLVIGGIAGVCVAAVGIWYGYGKMSKSTVKVYNVSDLTPATGEIP